MWYLHVDTYFVDFAHEVYQYSLKMANWGPKHVAV